jgi:integrase
LSSVSAQPGGDFGHIDVNPIAKIGMVSVDPIARVRFLSGDEERRLRTALSARNRRKRLERVSGNAWRHERGQASRADIAEDEMPDYLEPMVLIAMNTGLRRGELLNLLWSDVDLENADLTVAAEGSKTRRVRHVPLKPEAQKLFKDWRSSCASRTHVFASPRGERFITVKRSNTSATGWCSTVRR